MAALTGAPEWLIDTTGKDFDGKSEATYAAQSIKDVADHYSIRYLDQKTIDWINLLQCIGVVYGTRLFAMRARRQSERPARPMPPQPVRSQNPTQQQNPVPKPNGAAPHETRTGIVPGLGEIEFPENHPLAPKWPDKAGQ